ncbi:MAG: class I SAM-dependent methyltransferase [Clostridium sp.]|nr:class I SAM-dependent methyltransferase [Clostridium sp.]
MSELARRVNQCRKPNGELGRIVIEDMNSKHYELTSFGLKDAHIKNNYNILDIGCGGGRTVNRLSKIAENGNVFGMDYSYECVKSSKEYNEELIKSKKVSILQASVEEIPFKDNNFDIVTAVETIYFWPDLVENFKEVKRVLKKGGKFVIINEMYNSKKFKEKNDNYEALGTMKILTPGELRDMLLKAGFENVEYKLVEERNWIRYLCEK